MFQEQENLLEEYPSLKTNEIIPTFTLFITVENVEQLYNELSGKVKIAKELHQTFYGKDKVKIAKELHKTFYDKSEFAIFDNNGNILTISC